MEDKIRKLEKRVRLLIYRDGVTLSESARDNCSEISRLFACWVLEQDPRARAFVAKGTDVVGVGSAHDILFIIAQEIVYLVDPTVWQIFPNRENVLMGTSDSLERALDIAANTYKGNWAIAEELTTSVCKPENIESWTKIVTENLIR
jgi:sulfur transfer complex TusBCD TusB component (DsrH family)